MRGGTGGDVVIGGKIPYDYMSSNVCSLTALRKIMGEWEVGRTPTMAYESGICFRAEV